MNDSKNDSNDVNLTRMVLLCASLNVTNSQLIANQFYHAIYTMRTSVNDKQTSDLASNNIPQLDIETIFLLWFLLHIIQYLHSIYILGL